MDDPVLDPESNGHDWRIAELEKKVDKLQKEIYWLKEAVGDPMNNTVEGLHRIIEYLTNGPGAGGW